MQPSTNRAADTYVPLYFLASVGAGGLAVTFFMYLLFWVPHTGRPVPIFEDISTALAGGSLPQQVAIIAALAGIAFFAFLNVKSLIWNLTQFAKFKDSERGRDLKNSNAETTFLAMPLALAMTVNTLFIVGLVFVPGLWGVVEYLFPLAMLAFIGIAWIALRYIADFLGRVLSKGGLFDVTAHNSFAQLLPAFALAMIGVGFSAPAAMSMTPQVVAVSLVGSTIFAVATIIYATVAMITAFNSMLHYGTAKEAGPTLMIVVPIVTTIGILFLRQGHSLHTTFEGHATAGETLVFLAQLIAIQLVFLGLGLVVLKAQGYFKNFVFGTRTSPGSYALVCPGVAFSVMMFFFANKGLVGAQAVDKFSVTYWLLTAIALASQFAMVWLLLRLNRQHFSKPAATAAIPAE